MDAALEAAVHSRADHCCEYCRIPQNCHPQRFHIDHIIARQHGGQTAADNLALCCLDCNLHKGPNIAGIDPENGRLVPLFNPRTQPWGAHFAWRGALILGLTPAERATIAVLALNRMPRLIVRQALIEGGFLRID